MSSPSTPPASFSSQSTFSIPQLDLPSSHLTSPRTGSRKQHAVDEHQQCAIGAFVRVRPFTDKQIHAFQSSGGTSSSLTGMSSPLPLATRSAVSQRACLYRTSPVDLVVDQQVASFVEKYTSRDVAFTFDRVMWSLPQSQREYFHPSDVSMAPMASLSPSDPSREVADQEAVFSAVGAPAVEAAIRGVNACVFAFGQTGSGKSYTMFGTPQEPGIAPRTATKLFEELNALGSPSQLPGSSRAFVRTTSSMSTDSTASSTTSSLRSFQFSVEVGCFEIYNEKIYDLLARSKRKTKQSPLQREESGQGTIPRTNSQTMAGYSYPSSPALLSTEEDDEDEDDLRYTMPQTPTQTSGCPSRQSPTTSPEHKPLMFVPGPNGGPPIITLGGSPRFYSLRPSSQSKDSDTVAEAAPPVAQPLLPSGSNLQHASSCPNLHATSSSVNVPAGSSTTNAMSRGLRIRHDAMGTFVEGLLKEVVEDEAALVQVIQSAMKHRCTSANFHNDVSSRSHAILFFSVTQDDKLLGSRKTSTLHLVDLAGSERGAKLGATGQKLAESKKINLSLTTLRRVVDQMIDNISKRKAPTAMTSTFPAVAQQAPVAPHLPVRDSKLTEVMAECFGGNSLTSMIATVSPHGDHCLETLDSLRYCNKAKGIVNRVRPNEERIAVALQCIQHEMDRYRRELEIRMKDDTLGQLAVRIAKKDVVVSVLSNRVVERRTRCEELQQKAQCVTLSLRNSHKTLQPLLPLADSLYQTTSELQRVQDETTRMREAIALLEQSLCDVNETLALEQSALSDLMKKPLPSVLADFFAAQRRCWRLAFITAAKEAACNEQKRLAGIELRRLRSDCDAVARKIDEVASLTTPLGPEWENFHRLSTESRDLALAFSQACDARHAEIKSAENELRATEALLQVEKSALAKLTMRVNAAQVAAQEAVSFSKSLTSALEEKIRLREQELLHLGDESILRSRKLDISGETELLLDAIIPSQQAADEHSAQRHLELDAQVHSLAQDVEALEHDVRCGESELSAVESILEEMRIGLLEQSHDVLSYEGYLAHAEHSARTLSLPDAKRRFADAPLANAVMESEKVTPMRATVPSHVVFGSLDRTLRSASRDSTVRRLAQHQSTPGASSTTPGRAWRGGSQTPSARSGARLPLAAHHRPIHSDPSERISYDDGHSVATELLPTEDF